MKEPEQTCPRINEAIKEVRNAIDASKRIAYCLKHETWNDLESIISDLDWSLADLEDSFEYCREQAANLREWGNERKEI